MTVMKSAIAGKAVRIAGPGGLVGGVARYLSGQRCRLVLVAGADASLAALVTELRWNGADVTHVVVPPERAAGTGWHDALPHWDGPVDAVVDIAGAAPEQAGSPGGLCVNVFVAQAQKQATGAAMPPVPSASFRIGPAMTRKIARAARRRDGDGWCDSPREYLDLIGKLVAHAIEYPGSGVVADMWLAEPGRPAVRAA